MNIFLDTSSLFKLYHSEAGTDELMAFFKSHKIENIFLAEITLVEFSSVVWRKVRMKELDAKHAQVLIGKFDGDSKGFNFVPDNIKLKTTSQELLRKHWNMGLRTLDSLQLSSALSCSKQIHHFFTSDSVLSEIANMEGFDVK